VFNIRDGRDAKNRVQGSSEPTEGLVDPESTKKAVLVRDLEENGKIPL